MSDIQGENIFTEEIQYSSNCHIHIRLLDQHLDELKQQYDILYEGWWLQAYNHLHNKLLNVFLEAGEYKCRQ